LNFAAGPAATYQVVGLHKAIRSPEDDPRISDQVSLEPTSAFDGMGGHMNCKTDQIRAAWTQAIGSARYVSARFFDRSVDTVTFKRGMSAQNNPGFYRQLGKDPEQLTQAALELLAKKLKL
jgi:hypothetical protein